MGPPHHARRGRPEQAPNAANGFGVQEDPSLGSPSPCHLRPEKVPSCGLRQPQLGPAPSELSHAGPTSQVSRLQVCKLGGGKTRGAAHPRAAGSLTHLRRRRLPAPPAPAPPPRAAALASRPPAAALRLGRTRPLHSQQLRPRPLFPQREGRGRRGWDATGRATDLRFLLYGPFLDPALEWGRWETAVPRSPPRSPISRRPWAHPLQTSVSRVRAHALGMLRKARSLWTLS